MLRVEELLEAQKALAEERRKTATLEAEASALRDKVEAFEARPPTESSVEIETADVAIQFSPSDVPESGRRLTTIASQKSA